MSIRYSIAVISTSIPRWPRYSSFQRKNPAGNQPVRKLARSTNDNSVIFTIEEEDRERERKRERREHIWSAIFINILAIRFGIIAMDIYNFPLLPN